MTRVRNFVRLIWSITVLGCRADELTVKRTFWASVAAKEAEFATANGRSLVKWGKIDPKGKPRAVWSDSGPFVAELQLVFKKHADSCVVAGDGRQSDEVQCLYSAIKPLREICGLSPIKDYSPLMFNAVRNAFVVKGWCRGYVNRSANRIRLIFEWGVAAGLVPVDVWQSLTAIALLKAGRCAAHDNKRRGAIPDEHLQAVWGTLSQRNRDIFGSTTNPVREVQILDFAVSRTSSKQDNFGP